MADKLITISELSKKLNLIDPINKKPQNYILRFWEKKFKQIKPRIINKRRYYSIKQIQIIELINYLLKERRLTIEGAKNVLNKDINKLDEYNSNSLKTQYIKKKTKVILNKIRNLKKYGKKNSYKS